MAHIRAAQPVPFRAILNSAQDLVVGLLHPVKDQHPISTVVEIHLQFDVVKF